MCVFYEYVKAPDIIEGYTNGENWVTICIPRTELMHMDRSHQRVSTGNYSSNLKQI
jgi:hypothetical protein